MINRLLIRIKTVQLTYAFLQSQEPPMYANEKLLESLEASQKLYNYLLALIVKVTDYRRKQIVAAKGKYHPTEEDLNPNTRFIDNRIPAFICERSEVMDYCEKEQLINDFDTELYRTLLNSIAETETYQKYMTQKEAPTFAQEKQLWVEMLNTIFPQCDKLDEVLEERNIFWNDDLTTVLQAVVRTINGLKENTEEMLPVAHFKNADDEKFARELLKYCLEDYYDNVRLINTVAPNWEAERMALMDKVVMSCALAEIKHFPDIAVAISMNEYLEMAKHYCSMNSARFINGVLDKIVKQWRADQTIIKV